MESYNELVQVLRLSDAVKYAKFTPSHKENNDALDIIRESIDTIEKR
jgi:hypothetical protein